MTDTNKKDNILEVSNPSEGVVVVYPKPGEEVVIDMELGSLERKIVGRDLVITTYSGGSIVVANYVVLFAQDNGLAVKDSSGLYYGIEDMLEEGSRAGFTGEELPKVVIDRELSSAGVNDTGEKYLQSSSSKLLEDVFSKDLLVGSVDIDTQNPVAELNPNLDPYEVRSLFLNNDKKFDTDVVYNFNGSTFFNQNQSYFKPVKVGSGSVDIVALYGAKTEDNSGKVVGLLGKVSELIYNGGGLIAGDIDVDLDRDLFGADYMWAAQEIDLSDREGGVFINLLNKELFSDTFAESSDDWKSLINRKMSFKLTGSNVRIVDMFLTGLPEGVKIVESEGVDVFSGAGGALLRPKGTSSTLVVEFEYEEGFNEGNVVDANMVMSLNGYNSRTKTLIQVDNTFKLQFREVRSGADLINFSEVDAYTYSTALDPKKVITGEGGDFVVSGHGSNEYELGAGDDVFVSGKGVSVVDMGSGDDVYYAGLSGDIVDGGSGNNTIRIKGDVIEGVGASVVNGLGIVDVFNNVAGKVLFVAGNGTPIKSELRLEFEGGVGSSLKNFSNLYLSDKVNSIEVESTFNLSEVGAFNLYANEKVVAGSGSAKVVDFGDSLSRAYINMQEGYFSTNSDVGVTGEGSKVKFWHDKVVGEDGEVYVNEIHKFVGSKGYVDEVVGSDDREVLVDKELGSVGNYVLDYSLLSRGIRVSYDAVDGYVNVDRDDNRIYTDKYKFMFGVGSKFVGTDYVDVYNISDEFGSLDIEDVGRTDDVVDYKGLNGGVSVDFTNDDEVLVTRYNASGKVEDRLKGFNRENVHLTDSNDVVKDNRLSDGIDGLGGDNRLDLSEVVGSLTLSLVEYNKAVLNISGLAQRYDYNNFNQITLGNGADTILFAGVDGMKVDAGGVVNTLEVVTSGVHAEDYVKNIEIGSGVGSYDKVYVVTKAGGTTAREVVSEFKGVSSYKLTNNDDRISVGSAQDLSGKEVDAGGSNFALGALKYVYDAVDATKNVLTDGDTLNITSTVASSGLDLFGSGAFERVTGFNSIVFDNGKFSGNLKINMNVRDKDVDSSNLSFRHIYGAKLESLGGGSRGYKSNNEINNNTAGANGFVNTRYDIDGLNTKITYGGVTGQEFYFRNFNKIVGAATADIFNVVASADVDLDIDGGSGSNELNYGDSDGNLYVSFIAGDVSIYKGASSVDYLSKAYDKYSGGLAKIVGGKGDDYFALDTLNVVFEIDGGEGANNFVSFANVTGSFTLANNVIDGGKYTSIQGFELTNNDDVFGVDIAQNYFYDGGRGVDQILFRNVTGVLSYEVNDSKDAVGDVVYTKVSDGSGVERSIKNFETFIGVNGSNTVFNIDTYSNSNDAGDYNEYFYLGGRDNGTIITNSVIYGYTSLGNEGLTMSIGLDTYRYGGLGEEGGSDYEFLTRVEKRSNGSGKKAVDWFSRVNEYTLSAYDDRVAVNVASLVGITAVDDVKDINSIDMGAGDDTVDFSESSNSVNIDFSNNNINGEVGAWKFSNWEKLILTSEDDEVELNSDILGVSKAGGVYSIDGDGGDNTLSFNGLTDSGLFGGTDTVGVVVDVSDVTRGVEVFVNDGSKAKLLDVTNFNKFVGSSFNDLFYGSAEGSTNYTKTNGLGALDYSKFTLDGFRGFRFDINGDAVSVITKSEISRFVDTADKHFTKFVGTNAADTFVLNSLPAGGATIIDIDGGLGANSLFLEASISATLTEGLVLDLNKGNLYRKTAGTDVYYNNGDGAGGVFETQLSGSTASDTDAIVKLKGIRVFGGTVEDDIYIADENLFASTGGSIDAGEGDDALYLQSGTGEGYLLDASKSIIRYKRTGAEASVKNVEKVYFGRGNDSVIIGSGSGVTEVDGGTGNNKIDLSNLLVAVTGDIDNLNVGSSAISLTNFNSYALTNYNDKIAIQGDSVARVLDGNKGINEVEYLAATDVNAIELTLGADYVGDIKRTKAGGETDDKLSNFSVYRVGAFGDTTVKVTGNKASYELEVASGNNLEIDYSTLYANATDGGINADIGGVLNVFKYDGSAISGIDVYKGTGGANLGNTAFTFKGSVGNDLYNLGAYTSGGVRVIEVIGDATSSKTVYASGLATGGNGVDYTFNSTNINVSGGGSVYNITSGASSDIGVVGLVGGSSGGDSFVFSTGALGSIRNDLRIDGLGGDDELDFSAETLNTGESMVVDFVENKISFGLAADDKTINLQNAIYNITSAAGAGDVEFKGLNEIRQYNLDASNSTGSTKVSYNGAGGAVEINVDAGGTVRVNKGTIVDTLAGIREYGATNFNDRISIAAAGLATLNASFDGGAGSDTLNISGYEGTGALTINLNATVNGVVWKDSGNRLDVKNVENLEISGVRTGTEQVTLGVSNDIASSVVTTFKAGEAGDNQNAIYSYNNRKSDATVINVLLDGSTLDSNYTTALASVSSGGRVVSTTLYGVVDYRFDTGLLDTLNVSITDFDLANYNGAYSFNAGTVNGANNTLSLSGVLNVNEIKFATAGGVSGLSFINGGTTRAFNNFNNLEFSANYRGITNFTVGDYTRLNLDLANLSRANKITLNTGALIVANGLAGNNTVTYNNGALRYTEGANSIEVGLANGSGSSSLTASSTFLNVTTAGATYAVVGNKPVNDMPRFVALNTGGSTVNFSGYTGTSNVFSINNVVADMGMHNAVYAGGTGGYDNNSRTHFTMQYGSTTIAGANNYVFSGGNDRVYFNSSSNASGGYVAPSITLNGGAGIDTLVLQPASNTDLGLLSPHNNNETYNGLNTSTVVVTEGGVYKSAQQTSVSKLMDVFRAGKNADISRFEDRRVDFNFNNFEILDLSFYDTKLSRGKHLVVTVGNSDKAGYLFNSAYYNEVIMPNYNPYTSGQAWYDNAYMGTNTAELYYQQVGRGNDSSRFLPSNTLIFNHGVVEELNVTASFDFNTSNGNAQYGYNLDGFYLSGGTNRSFKAKHVTNFDVLIGTTAPRNINFTFASVTAEQTLSVLSTLSNGRIYAYTGNSGWQGGGLEPVNFIPQLSLGGSNASNIANLSLQGLTIPNMPNYIVNSAGRLIEDTSNIVDNGMGLKANAFLPSAFTYVGIPDLLTINLLAANDSWLAWRNGVYNPLLSIEAGSSLNTLLMPKGIIYLTLDAMYASNPGQVKNYGVADGTIISGVDSELHSDKLILNTQVMVAEASQDRFNDLNLTAWSHDRIIDKKFHDLFADSKTGKSHFVTMNGTTDPDGTARDIETKDLYINHLAVVLLNSTTPGGTDYRDSTSHYVTFGSGGSVYQSNKVYVAGGIYFHPQIFASGQSPVPYRQTWNVGSTQDTADFSGIKNGDYAFMPTYAPKAMFNTVWQDASKFAVETDKTNPRYNPVFSSFTKLNEAFDKNLNGGRENLESIIAFGKNETAKDMSYLSESGSGVTSKTPLFYRLSGVEYIRGTDANDTFYMGKALGLSDATRDPYNSIVVYERPAGGKSTYSYYHPLFGLSKDANAQTNLATRLVEFYGAGGNNTLVNDMFTASHKTNYKERAPADSNVPNRRSGLITMDNITVYEVAGSDGLDLTLKSIRNGNGGNGLFTSELNNNIPMTKFYNINKVETDDGVVKGDNTTYEYMQLKLDDSWYWLLPGNAAPIYKTGTKTLFVMEFYKINTYSNENSLTIDLGGRYFRDADKSNVTNGSGLVQEATDPYVTADGIEHSLGVQVGGYRAGSPSITPLSHVFFQTTGGTDPQSYVTDDTVFDPNRYIMNLGGKSSTTDLAFQTSISNDVDIMISAKTTVNSTYTADIVLKNVDYIKLVASGGNQQVNLIFDTNLDFNKLNGKLFFFVSTYGNTFINKYLYDNYNYTYESPDSLTTLFRSKLDSSKWFAIAMTGMPYGNVNDIDTSIPNPTLPVTPRSASFVVKELLDTANTVQKSYNVLDDFYSIMGVDSDYKEASALHTYNFNEIDKVYTNAQESEAKAEAEATSDTVVDVVKQDSSNVADVDVTEQDTTADGVEVAVKDATETEDVVVVEEPVDVALANVQNADVEADVEAENNAENNAETVTEEGTNAEGTNANAEGVEADGVDAEGEANTDAEVEVALSDDMDALLGDMLGFEANSSADNSFNLNGLSTNAVNSEEAEVDEDFSNTMNQLSQLEDTTTQQDEHESIAFALDSSVDVADDGSANQTEQAKVKNTVGVGD